MTVFPIGIEVEEGDTKKDDPEGRTVNLLVVRYHLVRRNKEPVDAVKPQRRDEEKYLFPHRTVLDHQPLRSSE